MSEDFPGGMGALLAGFGAGSRVAGYRLEEQVGRGGMAVVFRARDERLRRLVALKIMAPVLAADEGFRQRFMRESVAAAAVDDPHIIPVFEAGEAGGVLFIAMRYVSGGDVRTMLRRVGPLSAGRAAAIISPVASALDAAHGAGLVHRDVKPANMLVDARAGRPDHVYLSDFGLSKGALSSAGLTGSGQFLGTLDYSAPEQIEGAAVDGRADEYSLACAAFEMLTGAPPFVRAQAPALIWAHMAEPPPLLTARQPGLPVAVDEVMTKALAKAPAGRYASCREFADALRAACGLGPYDSSSEVTGRADQPPAGTAGLASSGSPQQGVPVAAGPADVTGAGRAGQPSAPGTSRKGTTSRRPAQHRSRHGQASQLASPGSPPELDPRPEPQPRSGAAPGPIRNGLEAPAGPGQPQRGAPDASAEGRPGRRRTGRARRGDAARTRSAAAAETASLALAGRRASRGRLSLITALTVLVVTFCAVRIGSSVQAELAYGRISQLASLGSQVTGLVLALEDERDQTSVYIALPSGGRSSDPAGRSKTVPVQLSVVREQIKLTAPWVARVLAGLKAIGPGYPAQVRADAQSAGDELTSLPGLRQAAAATSIQPLDVIGEYTRVINVLLALDDQIDLNSGDAELAGTVQALSRISRIGEEYSVQRAIVMDGLTAGHFGPGMLPMLTASIAQQNAYLTDFATVATAQQRQLYSQTVAGSLMDRADAYRLTVVQYASTHSSLTGINIAPSEWFGDTTETIGTVQHVAKRLLAAASSRANAQRGSASSSAITSSAVAAALILLLVTAILRPSIFWPRRSSRRMTRQTSPGEAGRTGTSGNDAHPASLSARIAAAPPATTQYRAPGTPNRWLD